MKSLIGLVVLLVCVCCTQAKADDQPPCQQKCSAQYGTKWTACGDDVRCQAEVESQFRSCVQQCEKGN